MKEFLKPRQGFKVAKPEGGFLAADGESVELTPYWHRRLRDGDVTAKAKKTKVKAEK